MPKKSKTQSQLIVPSKLGCWNIKEEVGRGAFSSVYAVTIEENSKLHLKPLKTKAKSKRQENVSNENKNWVAKVAWFQDVPSGKRKTKKQKEMETPARLIFWEYQVYQNFLKDSPYIPSRPPQKICYQELNINDLKWRYLILEKLDFTLKQKFDEISFSSATIARIGIQILAGYEDIHSRNIIFRDVKPENFMIKDSKVYFVDFGASTKFVLHSGKHIDTGTGTVGTALFMSIEAHNNDIPSRRDDLISLSYMLLYLFCRSLPWKSCKSDHEVIQLKTTISNDDLFNLISDIQLKNAIQYLFETSISLSTDTKTNYFDLAKKFADILKIDSWKSLTDLVSIVTSQKLFELEPKKMVSTKTKVNLSVEEKETVSVSKREIRSRKKKSEIKKKVISEDVVEKPLRRSKRLRKAEKEKSVVKV